MNELSSLSAIGMTRRITAKRICTTALCISGAGLRRSAGSRAKHRHLLIDCGGDPNTGMD
jgi:hypothetical protein